MTVHMSETVTHPLTLIVLALLAVITAKAVVSRRISRLRAETRALREQIGAHKQTIHEQQGREVVLGRQFAQVAKENIVLRVTADQLHAELERVRATRSARLARALHACARCRRELAQQQRAADRLADQLLGSLGYSEVELARLGVAVPEAHREPGLDGEAVNSP